MCKGERKKREREREGEGGGIPKGERDMNRNGYGIRGYIDRGKFVVNLCC